MIQKPRRVLWRERLRSLGSLGITGVERLRSQLGIEMEKGRDGWRQG